MPKAKDDFTFMAAVKQVLLDEGGDKVTDDPDDPKGRTKYGITQKLLTAIGHPKKVDDLTEADAIDIYYLHFWIEYHCDQLATSHPDLASKVFNFCVTAGPDPAFRCLQRALRANSVDIKEDGVMGPQTRGAVANFLSLPDDRCRRACLLVAYRCECAGYYRDLDKPKFEAGWVARAYR